MPCPATVQVLSSSSNMCFESIEDYKRYSCPVPRVPKATIRPRSNAKIQQLLWWTSWGPVPMKKRRRFAAASLDCSGTNPRSHHKGATGRFRTGDQLYPILRHCQLGLQSWKPCKFHVRVRHPDWITHSDLELKGVWMSPHRIASGKEIGGGGGGLI